MIEQVAILGFGNMGEALVRGLRERQPRIGVSVLEKREERRERARELGATVFDSAAFDAFMATSDTVVLSIKPQDLSAIATRGGSPFAAKQVISVLAGTSLETLRQRLGTDSVARLMPSLTAQIGRAVVGVAFADDVPQELRRNALAIAAVIGSAHEVPEKMMAAVTGLSGSGVAYVFAFIHALALGGTRAGIPYPQSLEIAREVTAGAADFLAAGGEHPVSALTRVTSPAGTTIEGIAALERNGFSAAVIEAVAAAVTRAIELER